jgi:predicted transcriptional regulator YdeE
MPKIEVKSHPQMTVVGLKYTGKNEAGEIPQLWGKLMDYDIENRDFNVHAGYGISIMDQQYAQTMIFNYIAGFPVTEVQMDLPEEMGKFTIPEGEYAVITCPNLENIGKAYDAVYRWLAGSSAYGLDLSSGNFNFEYYGEEFNPPDSEKFFIYVPVKAK